MILAARRNIPFLARSEVAMDDRARELGVGVSERARVGVALGSLWLLGLSVLYYCFHWVGFTEQLWRLAKG